MPAHIRNSLLKPDFPYFEHFSTSVFPDPVCFLELEPPKPQLQITLFLPFRPEIKEKSPGNMEKDFFSPSHLLVTSAHRRTPGGRSRLGSARMGGGGSRGLAALHSSGWRPAFVSMAGASNPALRKELDSMFGQARARGPCCSTDARWPSHPHVKHVIRSISASRVMADYPE